jgi:hypothetical protein
LGWFAVGRAWVGWAGAGFRSGRGLGVLGSSWVGCVWDGLVLVFVPGWGWVVGSSWVGRVVVGLGSVPVGVCCLG